MSDPLVAATLEHLRALVAADTRNPPRRIVESGVMTVAARALEAAGFAVEIDDAGGGSVSLFARRGAAPRLLFNFHLDTVPASPGWSRDPFALHVEGDRAVGLGACDIKGGAAALLAAAARTRGEAAVLFSSDEEAGQAVCVRRFLERGLAFDGVVVGEPTSCRAVLAHRGIATVSGAFTGRAGHASRAVAQTDSAVHAAVAWGHAAMSRPDAADVRFNLGKIEGGEKANVIAGEARVRFGVRPPPGRDPREVVASIERLAPDGARVTWELGFLGPTLPAGGAGAGAGAGAEADVARGRAFAERLGLPVGEPVDFWTEAALFSERGHVAVVFGPGDIAQAHAADEWVAIEDLAAAAAIYTRLLGGDGVGVTVT